MLRTQSVGVTERTSQVWVDASKRSVVRPSHRWMPLAILAASVLITLVFLKILPVSFALNESTDYSATYAPAARSLLAGRGLSRGDENPVTAYPPGYPLVLAGTFEVCYLLGIPEEVGASAISVLGMGLVTVFIFVLTRMLWGILPALISSALWMTYPFALWLTKQPNSEIPFMVVFYGGTCLFWYALSRRMSARAYFGCGLLFGFAMLIRPIAIGIALVLSVVVWFVRRENSARVRALVIGMLLLGNVVAVFPWEAWVYAKTGNVIPLSTNGVKSMLDGLTFGVTTKGYRETSNVSSDVAEVMKNILAQADQIGTVTQLSSVLASEFKSHPLAVTKLFWLKFSRSWYGTDSGRKEWPILLIQMAYLALAGWSLRLEWKEGGIYRVFAISALLTTLYFWMMTFLALSILRYMVPGTGLLFVLVGGAVASRWSLRRRPLLKTWR